MDRKSLSAIDGAYIKEIWHELYQVPEIGFDLPETLSIVKQELTRFSIPFTEEYGRCSLVATINADKKACFTYGIRADMDGLPIVEETGFPFSSKIPGHMHACGHDAHTAMLLGLAKALSREKEQFPCCLKLIFQAAEEVDPSGARAMVEDGVMDDIDFIIGQHVEGALPAGTVGICPGASMAAKQAIKMEFFGATAHGSQPQAGKNALAMAIRAYDGINQMLATELDPFAQRVLIIGMLSGGTAANIVPGYAVMEGTLRTYDKELEEYILQRLQVICQNAAQELGGTCRVGLPPGIPALYNDPAYCEAFFRSAKRSFGQDAVCHMPPKMSTEDFAYYLTEKPGLFFRLGVRNEEKGWTALSHNSDFRVDETALPFGASVLLQFLWDYRTGI